MTTDERVLEHFREAEQRYNRDNIVVCALQGSQNYGLDYENSDVDTKLIVTPSLDDICRNRKPVSTTHIRANDEHTDDKDIRLYIETFRKQNLNFLEILFTQYSWCNPLYFPYWSNLIRAREDIAHMNPNRAVRSMCGIAKQKYHAMCHPYPSKIEIIQKYGYDGKQVHHLLRVKDHLRRYIAGESYAKCLRPSPEIRDRLMAYKRQEIPFEIAELEAQSAIEWVDAITDSFCSHTKDQEDPIMRELLEDTCTDIIKTSIRKELEK